MIYYIMASVTQKSKRARTGRSAPKVAQGKKEQTIVLLYPGRFQPMGPHHAETYRKLQKRFGDDTYIVTSNKVKLPKSPLNFEEREQVINQFGIDKVIQVVSPYGAREILDKYDPETTVAVYAVGEKDMEGPAARFNFKPKKDGTPQYYQRYEENIGNLEPYTKHAYMVVAPHEEIRLPDGSEMSGTSLRKLLETANEKTFEQVWGFFNEEVYEMLKGKFQPLGRRKMKNKKKRTKKKRNKKKNTRKRGKKNKKNNKTIRR